MNINQALSLKIGTTLKSPTYNYHIDKLLGQGSFGITYLATTKMKMQGSLGGFEVETKVAIKEFFMHELNSRENTGCVAESSDSSMIHDYRRKFRREAENLSHLNHKNIVKVLEVFDANNTCYYVMQYIEGASLDEYVRQIGKLPEEEAVTDIRIIANALKYMHSQKMLHLDLKPKNIMRRQDGQLFLIDFGLSKQYDEKGEPESSTTVGMGTPGYAPIEQSNMNGGNVFPATLDVYALGATFFKILTGHTPPTASEVLNGGFPEQILSECGVTPRMIGLIRKAMSPMKAMRPQTVDAFIQLLDGGVVEEETVVISEDEPSKPVPPKPDASEPVPPVPIGKDYVRIVKRVVKYIIYGVCSFVIFFFILGFVVEKCHQTKSTDVAAVEKDSTSTSSVKDKQINGADGKPCIYTGLMRDGVPNGIGKAVYQDDRDYYEGAFENGKRVANLAKFAWKNGDTYEGSFVDDQFDEGKFISKSNGYYFVGKFNDFQPSKGVWYDNKGNVIKELDSASDAAQIAK